MLVLLLSLDGAAIFWLTQPEREIAAEQENAVEAAEQEPKAADSAATAPSPGAPALADKSSEPPEAVAKTQSTAGPTVPAPQTTGAAEPAPTAPPAAVPHTEPAPPSAPEEPERAETIPPPPPPPDPAPAEQDNTAAMSPAGNLELPDLPPLPPSAPLREAPDPALVEKSASGLLPVVGRDGREAWSVYARPFDQRDNRPRISVVLYGLGTSAAATKAAIQGLPGAITLAFSPYADGLSNWMADARAAGHEILMMVPMEPRNYPEYDPGPQALLTTLTGRENTERLEWMLGRGIGYVGVTDFMGSRFTSSATHMRSFFRNLKKRGLMFLESRVGARAISGDLASASRVPFASAALYIDSQASRPAIDGQLAEAERLANSLGAVVAMGFLYPVTLERLAKWAATVEKRGITLAPVSAIARRRN